MNKQYIKMGKTLITEKNSDNLLDEFMSIIFDITKCDKCIIYISKNNVFYSYRTKIKSKKINRKDMTELSITPGDIYSDLIKNGGNLIIEDFQSSKVNKPSQIDESDDKLDYNSNSVALFTMENEHEEIIGILEIANFSNPIDEELVSYLSELTAIKYTMLSYSNNLSYLLDSFVVAMSNAINERSHYTANHTKNMVNYAEKFLEWAKKTEKSFSFSPTRKKEFLMSVWLHDIGKLTIPLEIMDKDTRLAEKLQDIETRFELIVLYLKTYLSEKKITEEEFNIKKNELKEDLEFITECNKKTLIDESIISRIMSIGSKTYTNIDNEEKNLLTEEEISSLCIAKGTLTVKERAIIENHAIMTDKILNAIKFPEEYRRVPLWAASHHEFLNGKGYPKHLTRTKIEPEVRLLTILDIFDALTAKDRPYKKTYTVEQAFDILKDMAKTGAIDIKILNLFERSKAWQ